MINIYRVTFDTIYHTSMTSHSFIKIKRPVKPVPKPQPPEAAIPAEVEPTQPLEIELPEQPETIVQSDLVTKIPLEESVFGCGWSLTELRNEFSGRQ